MKYLSLFFAIVAVAAGGWYVFERLKSPTTQDAEGAMPMLNDALAIVEVPNSFTEKQAAGKITYNVACATCHGENAQGRDGLAPPLVHRLYEPSHHSDIAFVMAAQNGVRAHHWAFGNMPAIEGVTKADVLGVAAYVRALQRENGIE